MSKQDKSYWLGVAVLVSRLVTSSLFLASCLVAFRWIQAQGFAARPNPAGFWRWLWNDQNKDQFEPLLALLALIGTPVSLITTFVLDRLNRQPSETLNSPASLDQIDGEWDRVRPKLINVVRHDWVKAHLDRNLAKASWIHLGVEEVLDSHGLSPDIERLVDQRRELVTRKSLIQLFEDSAGRILILGEPGSGKTITLVKLCESLLDRAEHDASAPVPIALRLASWAIFRLPFEQWLVAELKERNLGSKTILDALEGGHRIALLLDGLDEVAPAARGACLTAIESYRETHPVPLAVCCRWEEYQALPKSFAAIHALRILPLTPGQIGAYLSGFRGDLETLRRHLGNRAELRDLATTPLMLSILARIYLTGNKLADLPDNSSAEAWRDIVFESYVRIMFDRKGYDDAKISVARSHAIHYLQQIARRMQQWSLPVLYLEHLHCGWLRNRWRYALVFGLTLGLVGGLTLGLTLGLILGEIEMFISMVDVIAVGLILGFGFGLAFGWFSTRNPMPPKLVADVRFQFRPRKLLNGFIFGSQVVLFSILVGMIAGLFGGFIFWEDGGVIGAIMGLLVGANVGMIAGCIVGPIIGLIDGVSEQTTEPESAFPNSGIRISGRNCLRALFVLTPLGGAVGCVFGSLFAGGLIGVSLAVVFFGGLAAAEHYSTRVAVAWEKNLPFPLRTWRLIIFLDAMGDLILLHRVGGGWTFAHGLLLDYLAAEPFGHDAKTVEERLTERS